MDTTIHGINSSNTNAVSVVYALEPWMTKQQLANHLSMSKRWVEMRVREGMPMMHFGNRARFKASQVENWISKQAKGTRQ
jgi:excisionase family DNA binding protein